MERGREKTKLPLEIEYKFAASEKLLQEIAELSEVAGCQVLDVSLKNSSATYLDTADKLLLQNNACLRIRKTKKKIILTFKKGTQDSDGRFERVEVGEVITPLDEDRILRGVICNPRPLKLAREIIGLGKLQKNFELEKDRIAITLAAGGKQMELALDRLTFIKDGTMREDFEVELENISTSPSTHKKTAQALQKQFNLIPQQDSKYGRGNQFFNKKIDTFNLEDGLQEAIKRVHLLCASFECPKLIHVAGPSSSGKTSQVTDKLVEALSEFFAMRKLSQDDYTTGIKPWDNPDNNDLELQMSHLADIKTGKHVWKPNYSFITGLRQTYSLFYPGQFVVFEGIHALHPKLEQFADLKIYVDADPYVMLMRRLLRDCGPVGRTKQKPQEVLQNMMQEVFPLGREYVEPTKKNADLIIKNNFSQKELERLAKLEIDFQVKEI